MSKDAEENFVFSRKITSLAKATESCFNVGGSLAHRQSILGNLDNMYACADSNTWYWIQPNGVNNSCIFTTYPKVVCSTMSEGIKRQPFLCRLYGTAVAQVQNSTDFVLCPGKPTEIWPTEVSGHVTDHVTVKLNDSLIPVSMTERETETFSGGVIAGSVAGGVFIAVLILALVVLLVIRRRKLDRKDPERTDSAHYETSLHQDPEYYNAKDQSYSPLHLSSSTHYSEPTYDYSDVSANQKFPYEESSSSGKKQIGETLSVEHEYITVLDDQSSSNTVDEQTSNLDQIENEASVVSGEINQERIDRSAKDSEVKVDKRTTYFPKLPGLKGKHFKKNVARSETKEKSKQPVVKKAKHETDSDEAVLRDGEIRRVKSKINYFNKRFS